VNISVSAGAFSNTRALRAGTTSNDDDDNNNCNKNNTENSNKQ